MLKIERHSIILEELRTHNRVKSIDLCGILDVSEDTIRRDIEELDQSGQLKKSGVGQLRSHLSQVSKSERLLKSKPNTPLPEKPFLLSRKGRFL